MPKIVAVQAEKSNAIGKALENGDFQPIHSGSIADSINVDVPRNGYFALKCLKEYESQVLEVSDGEILKAQSFVAKNTGHFCEPAAAASFAGFLQIKDELDKEQRIVILSTGNGLKDIQAAEKGIHFPQKLFSDVESVQEYLNR
jgi:threonine synthase